MPKVDFREEVVNVALAELLEHRGMVSVPETIRKSIARKTRDLPDIIVADLLGIRMVIEGRFNARGPARISLLKDVEVLEVARYESAKGERFYHYTDLSRRCLSSLKVSLSFKSHFVSER